MNGGMLDGIGRYTENLLISLRQQRGISVVPATFPVKPWEKPLAVRFPERRSFRLAYGLSAGFSAATSLPFLGGTSLGRSVDVFHAPDHLIPNLANVPVVATICDAFPVKQPEWVDAGVARLRVAIVKAAASWADHVIAISASMVPDLVTYLRIPERSITVVHMGIGRDWLEATTTAEQDRALAKYGLKRGYFLFVGTLQPRKNVETLIAAYETLPSEIRTAHRLVVIGGPGWQSERLIKRLRSKEKSSDCSWLQYVPSNDMRVLYQCAGAFVFPSLAEGFGIPILEAFASRVPVVTSNVSSLPEVAGDAAILVDPRSVSELARAMARIASDARLRQSLVTKGFDRAREMSWEACAQRTLEVYRKVV